jgi:hypothetical protein
VAKKQKVKAPLSWKLLGAGFAIPAGVAVRKLADTAWYAVRGNPPPKNPVAPRTTWPEALAWAAVSGVAGAGARIVASAGAARTYQSLTGKLPPGLESGGPTP